MASAAPTSLYRETFPDIPPAPRTVGPHIRHLLTGYGRVPVREVFWLLLSFIGVPGWLLAAILRQDLPFVLLFWVFLGGLIWWYRGIPVARELFAARRKIRVYHLGCPVRARVVGKVKRVTTGRGEPCRDYRLAWQFDVDGKTYLGHLDHPDRRSLQRLHDGAKLMVLIEPTNPSLSVPWMDEVTLARELALASRDDVPKRRMTKTARRLLLGTSTFHLWFGGAFLGMGLFAIVAILVQRHEMWFGLFIGAFFALFGGVMFFTAADERQITKRAYARGEMTKGRIYRRGNLFVWSGGHQLVRVSWTFDIDGVTYAGSLLLRDPDVLEQAFPTENVSVLYDPDDPTVNALFVE